MEGWVKYVVATIVLLFTLFFTGIALTILFKEYL